MEARLHLIRGNPQGKQVEIPPGTLTVGRAEDRDLIIASTRVSRHHCEIVNDQGRLTLRDAGSGNGTLVNGEKVQEQVLRPGDEVQIGPLTFQVEIDGVRGAPAKPVAKPAAAAKPAPAAQARPAAPARPAPAAQARPAAPKPAAPAKPGAKPKVPAPPQPKRAGGPGDLLASLERLASQAKPGAPSPAKPAGPAKKNDDILEISDDDLLDKGG